MSPLRASTLLALSIMLLVITAVSGEDYGEEQYQLEEQEQEQEPRCPLQQARRARLQSEGRKMKKKGRVLLSVLLGLKLLALSVAVPIIVALALYSAWKGVTISLLAFMIASIVGLKSLINKPSDHNAHNVIVAKIPSTVGHGQEQWWRRIGLLGDVGAASGLGAGLGAGLDPYRGYGFQGAF